MPASPGYRCLIGRHLSYPLKFQEVASGLAPACEQIGLEVDFFSYQAPRPNDSRMIHPVLEIQYGQASHGLHLGTYCHRLAVRPVPRSQRAAAHALLLTIGLPQVQEWLLAPRVPYWSATSHLLRFNFDAAEQRLVCRAHDAA